MKNQQHAYQFIKDHTQEKGRIGIIKPLILDFINSQTKSLLDVGCGDANYHKQLVQRLKNLQIMVGLDISFQILSKANHNSKTQFKQLNCLQPLTQFNNKFDTVLQVFLHQYFTIDQLSIFFDNCTNWLNQNGQLIIISFDPNTCVTSKAYGKTINYMVIGETPLREGQSFQIKLGQWINNDRYYSPSFLCNQLQKRGYQTQINYVQKQQVNRDLYTSQQAKQIQDSRCLYTIKAIKPK